MVLCCLEGLSQEEAARQLGWTPGSVKGRLERGRKLAGVWPRGGWSWRPRWPSSKFLRLGSQSHRHSDCFDREVRSPVHVGGGIRALPHRAGSNRTGREQPETHDAGKGEGRSHPAAHGGNRYYRIRHFGRIRFGRGSNRSQSRPQGQAERTARRSSRSRRSMRARPAHGSLRRSLAVRCPGALGTVRWRHGNQVMAVAFSPDGTRIASGSMDEAIHLWDASTGKLLRILRGHEAWVSAVFFTPDGKQLISCGGDNTARVWDVGTGKELRRWTIHGGWNFALSPDGKLLAGNGPPAPTTPSLFGTSPPGTGSGSCPSREYGMG